MSRGFQDWRSLLMALDRRVFSSFSWTLLIEGMSNMMTPVFIPTLSYQGDLYGHFQKKRESVKKKKKNEMNNSYQITKYSLKYIHTKKCTNQNLFFLLHYKMQPKIISLFCGKKKSKDKSNKG